jgi:hypothetical protein
VRKTNNEDFFSIFIFRGWIFIAQAISVSAPRKKNSRANAFLQFKTNLWFYSFRFVMLRCVVLSLFFFLVAGSSDIWNWCINFHFMTFKSFFFFLLTSSIYINSLFITQRPFKLYLCCNAKEIFRFDNDRNSPDSVMPSWSAYYRLFIFGMLTNYLHHHERHVYKIL